MQHVKADHPLVGPDGEDRMGQALADRSGDILQGTKEALDMVRVEFEGGDHAEVGVVNPVIAEGLQRPDKGHKNLRARERKRSPAALLESPARLPLKHARGNQPHKFLFP